MALDPSQMDVLKSFCALILCGHHEDVFQRCKECLENAADEDKQLVKPQYYLISSDAGARSFRGLLLVC
ncbi:MAG: hypothetical protein K2K17_01980 [Lachnospiraceae bacterium]|nr:hypothetical protein [Lachnospiraceae bacterium]